MLHYIYTRPIGWVIGVMALGLVGWGVAAAHIGARRWRRVNLLLAVVALMAIVYATVLSRSEGGSGIILTPICHIYRRTPATRTLPRDADERFSLFSVGANAFQRSAAKVAPLG